MFQTGVVHGPHVTVPPAGRNAFHCDGRLESSSFGRQLDGTGGSFGDGGAVGAGRDVCAGIAGLARRRRFWSFFGCRLRLLTAGNGNRRGEQEHECQICKAHFFSDVPETFATFSAMPVPKRH